MNLEWASSARFQVQVGPKLVCGIEAPDRSCNAVLKIQKTLFYLEMMAIYHFLFRKKNQFQFPKSCSSIHHAKRNSAVLPCLATTNKILLEVTMVLKPPTANVSWNKSSTKNLQRRDSYRICECVP